MRGENGTDARPLKVAIFSDYFPPHVGGGVERVVHELSRGLAARGEDVRLFTLNTVGAPQYELVDGVEVRRAPALQLTRRLGVQSSLSPQLLTLALRELRRDPPDLVHAHNRFFSSTLVAVLLSAILRRPLVTTMHLGAVDRLDRAYRYLVVAYERTVGRAIVYRSRRIIAVSEAVAIHARVIGANGAKVRVVPNGVDIVEFYPDGARAPGPLRVACVGRLIHNKAPHHLIEAARIVLAQHPEMEFVFAGDGPLRAELEKGVGRSDLARHVRFLGTRQDVAAILRDSDMLVRPSLMDGMPLTVLEGMACGLPVVATPVGGTPEVVREGVTGLLVEPGDISGLAAAMIRLAEDPALRQWLGRNGRRLVERSYSWDRVVEGNLEVYEEVLGRPIARAARPLAAAA